MDLIAEFMVRSSLLRCGVGAALALLIACSGCGGPTSKVAGPPPLRIAAASDLRHVLPRLADRFEQKTGVKLSPSFGASGQLAAQIKQGAPFDIFLAANRAFVDDLAAQGLIEPGSVRPYARGSLVLAVYQEFAGEIRSLQDLTKPVVKRIALANPETAPYGKAGKQALERAGLFKKIEPKIVLAESVGQALIYAQKGDAETALIGRAIAQVAEIQIVEIDAELYDPIIQALGIVTASGRSAEARAFADFVLAEEGQTILAEFGLAQGGGAAIPGKPHQKPLPDGKPASRLPEESRRN
jgi:molybdate transport system substrate-binding protein